MTALMTSPYSKVLSLIVKSRSLKSLPPIMPISGVISPDTMELTIATTARPMTTATARSMTLPRAMNSLNSL